MQHTKFMSTGNNKSKRVCHAYPFLISFLLLLSSVCSAQNISKYYKSSKQENGVLYFVMPKMEFDNKSNGSNLNYDITYLTTLDSATVNISFTDDSVNSIDRISFVQNGKEFSSNPKKIYIEPHKSKWVHRYTSRFLFNDLHFLFAQEISPKMILHTSAGAKELTVNQSSWRKNSVIVSRVFSMIKLSKGQ